MALGVRVCCPLEEAEVRKGLTLARDHTMNEQQRWVLISNASGNSCCYVTFHTWIHQRCLPGGIPSIGKAGRRCGRWEEVCPGVKVIRASATFIGTFLSLGIPRSETTKKKLAIGCLLSPGMAGAPGVWAVCWVPEPQLSPSCVCVPFQGFRGLAGVTAPGILSPQSQSQPCGLHTLLQVSPGLEARAGAGGLWGFLGWGKGCFTSQPREQLV